MSTPNGNGSMLGSGHQSINTPSPRAAASSRVSISSGTVGSGGGGGSADGHSTKTRSRTLSTLANVFSFFTWRTPLERKIQFRLERAIFRVEGPWLVL
jgi:hypothetical protein